MTALSTQIPAADAFRFESCILENYLAVSTWILNESSIACQEKKHQRFSLSGVDLEAGRFKFLGENLLGVGQSKMSFPPLTPSYNVQQELTQNPLNSSNSPFRDEQTV